MDSPGAVCNASPLIVLAKANFLGILPKIFPRVVVPRTVADELADGPPDDPINAAMPGLSWLEVISLAPPVSRLASVQLGPGEAEVIEWALRNRGFTALLDDHAARQTAAALGVHVCGTLGLLTTAFRLGIIPSFTDAVTRIRDAGLYLADDIVDAVTNGLEVHRE